MLDVKFQGNWKLLFISLPWYLKEYFSLEDLHLPPIGSNYQALAQRDIGEYYSGPRYENKPFTLPKVEDTKYNLRNVPKTYTTRKGALLLYAEDFFIPGSPKPRKRRRKFKKQPTMKLKTIGDLRNYILDYRNGVCHPFLLYSFSYWGQTPIWGLLVRYGLDINWPTDKSLQTNCLIVLSNKLSQKLNQIEFWN